MKNPALPNGLDLKRPSASRAGDGGSKKFSAENPAQPIDIPRFGREDPRKSKEIQGNPTLLKRISEAKWRRFKKTQTDRPDLRPGLARASSTCGASAR